MSTQFINNPEKLLAFCQDLNKAPWIAVDTEFLREKTYYPQLCLIQVATTEQIACIDPLAISDINPLLDVFYRPGVTLIFHAARQDLELLYLERGKLPRQLFDTQIAASLLGHGDQIGYANLVKQYLDVNLDKAHSRTDWSKRPLDSGQIDYAADDVRYLRELYPLLLKELEEKDRLTWLADDFANLSDTRNYRLDSNTLWQRVKGAGRLKSPQLAIVQQLSYWREQQATESNRPRRWILKDEVLIDLAKLAPSSLDKMNVVRGLEPKTLNRHGREILKQIALAQATPRENWPKPKKVKPLSTPQQVIIDAMMAILRQACAYHVITPSAVASRRDLEALVTGDKNLALLQGWRFKIVGQTLQHFLDGKITLTIRDGELIHQQQE